jgi:hypothetical protein
MRRPAHPPRRCEANDTPRLIAVLAPSPWIPSYRRDGLGDRGWKATAGDCSRIQRIRRMTSRRPNGPPGIATTRASLLSLPHLAGEPALIILARLAVLRVLRDRSLPGTKCRGGQMLLKSLNRGGRGGRGGRPTPSTSLAAPDIAGEPATASVGGCGAGIPAPHLPSVAVASPRTSSTRKGAVPARRTRAWRANSDGGDTSHQSVGCVSSPSLLTFGPARRGPGRHDDGIRR